MTWKKPTRLRNVSMLHGHSPRLHHYESFLLGGGETAIVGRCGRPRAWTSCHFCATSSASAPPSAHKAIARRYRWSNDLFKRFSSIV